VRSTVSACILLGSIASLAACDDEKPAGNDPVMELDASVDPNDGSDEDEDDEDDGKPPQMGEPDGGVDVDAGDDPPPVEGISTNLINAELSQPSNDADSAGVRVTSFSFMPEDDNLGSGYYMQWFLTLESTGDMPACYANVVFVGKDASGSVVFEEDTYADSTKFESGGLMLNCIAPGAEGVAWTNAFNSVHTAVDDVAEVAFDVSANPRDIAPVAGEPHVEDVEVFDRFGTGRASYRGTLRTGSQAIDFPSVDFYLLHPEGYIEDSNSAIEDTTVSANSSWAFQTTATDHVLVEDAGDYLALVDFLMPQAFVVAANADEQAVVEHVRAFKLARKARLELRAHSLR
jgi:hypothetical protein